MAFLSKLFSSAKDPLQTHASELQKINSFKDEVASLSQDQIKAEIKQ